MANQVRADKARLSTCSFFQPVFSIGASSITVTEVSANSEGGRKETYLDAKNITLRAGNVPLFWFPGFRGEDAPADRTSGPGGPGHPCPPEYGAPRSEPNHRQGPPCTPVVESPPSESPRSLRSR